MVADILHRCLHPDPATRPSASELHKTLLGEKSVPAPPPVPPPPSAVVPTPAPRLPDPKPAKPGLPSPPGTVLGGLVLIGPGGAELALGARLAVGRTILTTRFGDGGKYAGDQQFVLDKQDDGWYVVPVAGTTNATLLNGDVLAVRTKLTAGDTLGVGSAVSKKSKLDMQVRV